MEYGELEPVPEEMVPVVHAEGKRIEAAWERECVRRVPELPDVESDRDYWSWQDFLAELDDMDAGDLARDLADCAYCLDEIGVGWIEDAHGGAVYVDDDDD